MSSPENNSAALYILKKMRNSIKGTISKASDLVKENTDIDALLEAKMISNDNISMYENLRDMYVNVNFGNNVILPFYIDNNVATCLKATKPKETSERKLKGITELRTLLELKGNASILEVKDVIADKFGYELEINSKPNTQIRMVSNKLENDAGKLLVGSAWEASLKKFTGEMEVIGDNIENLALDSDLLKKAKKISSVLGMMENKQRAILNKQGFKSDHLIEIVEKNKNFFEENSVNEFLEYIKKEDINAYEDLTKPKGKTDVSLKMMGIYHIQELQEISPELQSILDMEINNKTNYKVKLMKEEQNNQKKDETIEDNYGYGVESSIEETMDFSENDEVNLDVLEEESYSIKF